MQYREENNYPKALLFSGGSMILLLVISYLITFGTSLPIEEVGTGGIVVNYGTAETGMGDDINSIEEPSVAPEANNTAPEKIVTSDPTENTPTSETSNKSVVTQNTEDAPAVTTSAKSTNNTPTTSTPVKESKPAVNPNALYKGKRNDGNGGGDGTGNTPGNQGDVDGDPLSSNYGKGGSGFGNTQLTLAGRKFVNIPRISDDGQTSGRVAVLIRVDKSGRVIEARAGVKGTTISDKDLWAKCEQAVKGASLNRLETAPDMQEGTVFFNFKVD